MTSNTRNITNNKLFLFHGICNCDCNYDTANTLRNCNYDTALLPGSDCNCGSDVRLQSPGISRLCLHVSPCTPLSGQKIPATLDIQTRRYARSTHGELCSLSLPIHTHTQIKHAHYRANRQTLSCRIILKSS